MRRWNTIPAAMLALALAVQFGCQKEDERSTTSSHRQQDAASNPQDASGHPDAEFMTKVAYANLAEVEMGRLADSKGSNADLKRFAQRMVEDHGEANRELSDLAQKKGVHLPTRPDDAAQKDSARLAELSGAEFDKKYAASMVDAHTKAVALFEEHSGTTKDADVRTFINKMLPVLREHLKMARDLSGKVAPTSD